MKWLWLIPLLLLAVPVFATGGTCPSGANYQPFGASNTLVTLGSATYGITSCYYAAANGSDSNDGLSEASGHPWLHLPGMPSCSGNCGTLATTCAANAGNCKQIGFILRGGDTWHAGNSGLTPYTGGTWSWPWGAYANCNHDQTNTGCIYFGVDQSWFTGGSWVRPIINGDNTTSTSQVASCTYTIGSGNDLITVGPGTILDNLELTGMCFSPSTYGFFVNVGNTGNAGTGTSSIKNIYAHGWTVTTAYASGSVLGCVVLGGGYNGLMDMDHIVIDGADSDPKQCAYGTFPSFYHTKDSIFRNTTQGVGAWCHDIHDNIFEFFNPPLVNSPSGVTHGNILECNSDSNGTAAYQPASTPNVFYNNIVRHATTNFSTQGQVDIWFCPNASPAEYWFNNIQYDVGNANFWDVAGPPIYSCSNSGGQYMFNNTLVDGTLPGGGSNTPNNTNGAYLTVLNNHLINSAIIAPAAGTVNTSGTAVTLASGSNFNPDSLNPHPWKAVVINSVVYIISSVNSASSMTLASSAGTQTGVAYVVGAQGYNDASEINMSDATATSQGYASTASRINTQNSSTSCANDATTPCIPTSGTNGTVGQGHNQTATYCSTLASFSSEPAISTYAANACKFGTTDGCAYNATTHVMTCPAQTATARPGTGVWDSGAYEYSASGQASVPSCAPGSGNYTTAQTVACTNPNSGTTIMCYTTNGVLPVTNGAGTACTTGTIYTTTISVSTAETLKVVAGTSILTDSTDAAYVYTFNVTTPTFSPIGGAYATAQIVTITSQVGAIICYTTDGSTPAASSPGTCSHGTTLANGGTITVSISETVQALGTESSFSNSAVASATYTIGGLVYQSNNCSVSAVATESAGNSYSWSCTPFATGDAVVFFAQCHPSSGTISAISLASSGWTFTQLVAPQTTGSNSWGALFGAIAPNTSSATFTATFTGAADCGNFATYIGGEFSGNNTTGGAVTFPVTGGAGGAAGGCTQTAANVIPTSNNNAVWFACLDTVTAISSPWFGGANDLSGDFAEYQILSGGAGISQTPTYTGSGVYVVEGTAILPLVQSAVGPPTNFIQVTQAPKVELQWTASTTPAVDYSIWRSTGGPFTKIKQGIIGTQWTDTNVERGVDYFYESQAYLPPPCKKKCDSAFSGQLQITCCQ